MLPSYVDVASRMYRVLWLVENVLRDYLETSGPRVLTTVPATMKETVSVLQGYVVGLHGGDSTVLTTDAAKAKSADRTSKQRERDDALKNLQGQLAGMERLGKSGALPPPSTAISRSGRPLDFVYLSFLSHALSLRDQSLHRQIATELNTLIAFRNAIMHFRDVGPDGFDHTCSLTWRVCHALGQDNQGGLWIGQWFGTTADPKRVWPRILSANGEGPDATCVDYGDFAVPPIGRFRPSAFVRDGRVLFPGGLYKITNSWIRIDPAWVEQRAVVGQSPATRRLVDSHQYECWIVPEVKAARIVGDEAMGPSGLRFHIGSVERRVGTNLAQTGFMLSIGKDGAVISDGIPAGHGDLIRGVFSVIPGSTAST